MFGEVVKAIEDAGLLDQSLIAFTADHGEAMYRENANFHWTHGYELVPEDIGAPLVLVGPRSGVPRGDYAGVTRSIDVFPTLAGLGSRGSGVQRGAASITHAVRGREPPPPLRAFSHTTMFYAPLRTEKLTLRASLFPAPLPEYMWVSVRDEDLYATRTRSADDRWSTRAFDLSVDPRAEHDLFDAGVAHHRELASDSSATSTSSGGRLRPGHRRRDSAQRRRGAASQPRVHAIAPALRHEQPASEASKPTRPTEQVMTWRALPAPSGYPELTSR